LIATIIGKGRLVRPHRIRRTLPSDGDAEVGRLALVGAVGGVIAPRERGHVDVPPRDILHGRIARLPEGPRKPKRFDRTDVAARCREEGKPTPSKGKEL
jgi:hypothetical protein